jgi:Fur family ferric uptake transcriptional regulator
MRLSTPRRLVLEALFADEDPVSAPQLSRRLSIDESSVYRNLEVLERHGLIRHVHLGHGPGLYVLVSAHELEYLYCERCAKVKAVAVEDLDPVRKQIKEQFGYHARFTHFAIVGLCEQCAARPTPAPNHTVDKTRRQDLDGQHHDSSPDQRHTREIRQRDPDRHRPPRAG